MALGPNKSQITGTVSTAKRDYIYGRAARLRWSVAQFTGAIIEEWFRRGCPPVDPIEKKLSPIPIPNE